MLACGMPLSARIPAEQALIQFTNGHEEIVTSVQLQADRPGAAVIFPVPGVPEVSALANNDLFDYLADVTRPEVRTEEIVVGPGTQLPVGEEIKKGLPRTLSLAIGAALLWMFVAICLGLYSAVRAGKFADRFLTIVALVGISLPVFWLGALMNHYLGFKLGWFPNGGYVELTKDPIDWAYHLILPWTCLAVLFIGFYSRVLRSNVLDTINEDYVRTARAKGLSERQIMVRHVLRNSLIPIVSLWGLDFGAVVGGGAILTETVFDLQGVGQYAAEAIGQLDVPPVLATTMFAAFFIVLLNAVVDILYAYLDPRIRLQ